MATQVLITSTQATTGPALVADWIAALERDGVSAKNREAYRTGLERLGEFLRPRGAEDATPADVRGFLAYLGQLGVSEQSQGAYRTILLKWISHVATARERARAEEAAKQAAADAAQQAAAVLNAERIEPFAPGQQVLMECADSEATAVLVLVDAVPEAPSMALPHADEISETQGESTWPLGQPRPHAEPPSPTGLAAVFDGATGAEPPPAALTIDFTSPAPAEEDVIEVEIVMDEPGDALPPAAFAPQEPAPWSTPAGAFTKPEAVSFLEMAPPAPVAAPVPEPVPEAEPEPEPAAPVPPVSEEGGAFGSFGTMSMEAFSMPAPPPAAFGAPLASFGAPAAEAMPVAPPAAADATPVRPMAAVMPDMGAAQAARRAERDAGMGEQVMDSRVASIPLGHAPSKAPARGAKPAIAVSSASGELKAKTHGWSLRSGGSEKSDLDLTQIRNLAATGEISPSALIRRPGGEWMKAGEYAPLKSVFQQAHAHPQGPGREMAAPRGPLVHPEAFAWLGAGLGCMAGSAAWWLVAVIAGEEVGGAAIIVGLLCGGLSLLISRGETTACVVAGTVATLLTMVVGRAAVYKTLAAGVMGHGNAVVDPLTFLRQGATGSALAWWGVACGVAALAGLASLVTRKH